MAFSTRRPDGGFEFTVLVDITIANQYIGRFYTDRESYNALIDMSAKIAGTSVVELTDAASEASMIQKLITMNR